MSFDLYNNKYDREFIKDNIYNFYLIDILITQDIDEEFVVKYILNEKYQLCKADIITIDDIKRYKPNLNLDIIKLQLISYTSDDDSIKNFEMIANNPDN